MARTSIASVSGHASAVSGAGRPVLSAMHALASSYMRSIATSSGAPTSSPSWISITVSPSPVFRTACDMAVIRTP